jgi:hypothetical protein
VHLVFNKLIYPEDLLKIGLPKNQVHIWDKKIKRNILQSFLFWLTFFVNQRLTNNITHQFFNKRDFLTLKLIKHIALTLSLFIKSRRKFKLLENLSEKIYGQDTAALKILDTIRPKIAISSFVVSKDEQHFFMNVKKWNRKNNPCYTICHVLSYDNVTSRGYLPFLFLIIFGYGMKK